MFYWTLNNVFSLVKSIVYKHPKSHRVLRCLCSILGIWVALLLALRYPVNTLRKKLTVALKVMPVTFWENGYDVTVCDLSYSNYHSISDLSIFDEYPGIHRYNTIGAFTEGDNAAMAHEDHIRERNFF